MSILDKDHCHIVLIQFHLKFIEIYEMVLCSDSCTCIIVLKYTKFKALSELCQIKFKSIELESL